MGTPRKDPVLVAGGGIGGLAAALALARQGLRVRVLERAAELGAGIQLGPNAFCAFDALGIGDRIVQEKLGLFREERSSAPCEPM